MQSSGTDIHYVVAIEKWDGMGDFQIENIRAQTKLPTITGSNNKETFLNMNSVISYLEAFLIS
jgi:hypothetical protein